MWNVRAIALPAFKSNPAPVLKILKILKDDESEYVRRSVANNLNDICKDNPDIVIDLAGQWLGKNKNTNRLVKHACRTLLKQGNQQVLTLFGFSNTGHIKITHFKVQPEVTLGDNLKFSFLLKSQETKAGYNCIDKSRPGKCRIEFAIDFVKANGRQKRKVFSFKKISTRKYYTGKHQLTIIVNGVDQLTRSFNLIL